MQYTFQQLVYISSIFFTWVISLFFLLSCYKPAVFSPLFVFSLACVLRNSRSFHLYAYHLGYKQFSELKWKKLSLSFSVFIQQLPWWYVKPSNLIMGDQFKTEQHFPLCGLRRKPIVYTYYSSLTSVANTHILLSPGVILGISRERI